ncbi:MAG: Uma2 family endonuclease [Cyanobacteria bacterium J06581_3]
MTNTLTLPSSNSLIEEKRVTLHDISWTQYQQMLTALPKTRAVHLTYSLGTLEISMPLEDHEQLNGIIGLFIRTLVIELGLKMKSLWSTTLSREDLDRGTEPDNAYYIQNRDKVAGKTVDLQEDPPPDLVVEVDISHTDIDKNALYAAMSVSELWRFDGRFLRVYQLEGDRFTEVETSPTFPFFQKQDLYDFIDAARIDEVEAELNLRSWVQQNRPNS